MRYRPALSLRLENPYHRRLYVRVVVERRALAARQPRPDRGFGIAREYEKLDDADGRAFTNDWRMGDRVLFFRNHLEAGRHVIRYLARVRAAGAATAPSVKVGEMYHPERFGLSESIALSARAAERK